MSRQTRAAITERKTRLDGSAVDFTCESLVVEPGRRAVVRYVTDREWRVGGAVMTVPVGTVTIGHFWVDRPYNVYHWFVAGRTLAYYCSIATDTTIATDLITYTDLTLDVLIRPNGEATVLDEDELPDDLAPPHRLIIAKAREALLTNPKALMREIEHESAAVTR